MLTEGMVLTVPNPQFYHIDKSSALEKLALIKYVADECNSANIPTGIYALTNYLTAVNTIEATNNGYADYVKAIGAVRRANGVPTVLGINADTEELMSLMVDKNGQPLNAPKSVDELKKIVSNQLNHSLETGSDALVFDPNSIVIGLQNHITFRMFRDTDYCIKNGMVGFQIYAMLDGKSVRPKHISKITGIKETVTV